jgi:hypothetical protein
MFQELCYTRQSIDEVINQSGIRLLDFSKRNYFASLIGVTFSGHSVMYYGLMSVELTKVFLNIKIRAEIVHHMPLLVSLRDVDAEVQTENLNVNDNR